MDERNPPHGQWLQSDEKGCMESLIAYPLHDLRRLVSPYLSKIHGI